MLRHEFFQVIAKHDLIDLAFVRGVELMQTGELAVIDEWLAWVNWCRPAFALTKPTVLTVKFLFVSLPHLIFSPYKYAPKPT